MRLEFVGGQVELARESVGDGVVFSLYVLWEQHAGGVYQDASKVTSDTVVEVFQMFVKVAFTQPSCTRRAVGPCQEARVDGTGWAKSDSEPDLDHGANELQEIIRDLRMSCGWVDLVAPCFSRLD